MNCVCHNNQLSLIFLVYLFELFSKLQELYSNREAKFLLSRTHKCVLSSVGSVCIYMFSLQMIAM